MNICLLILFISFPLKIITIIIIINRNHCYFFSPFFFHQSIFQWAQINKSDFERVLNTIKAINLTEEPRCNTIMFQMSRFHLMLMSSV